MSWKPDPTDMVDLRIGVYLHMFRFILTTQGSWEKKLRA